MYFTNGSSRAFEMLMRGKPGFDRYENGGCADCEDCNTCHFYRPHWKYQFCVYAECPYEPGKLTALRAARRSERKELITYSDIPRQLIEYSEDKNTGGQYHCKVSKQGHKSEWRTDRFYNTQYGTDESGAAAKGPAVFFVKTGWRSVADARNRPV